MNTRTTPVGKLDIKMTPFGFHKCIVFCAAWLAVSVAVTANDRFIDGFPDIPYLDIVSAVVGEPLVFDTASGTVAEVAIQFSEPTAKVFALYGEALGGLGWACTKTDSYLRCIREQSLIQLTAPSSKSPNDSFILRLEPLH